MDRTVFLNGAFLPPQEARLSVFDRGFLFADGIYEVSAVLAGRLVDNEGHLARLERSLAEVAIRNPYSRSEWTGLQQELVRRNALGEGVVYIEVTRGAHERDFAFPPAGVPPTVVMFTQAKTIVGAPLAETGARVVSVPDLRWKRRDIKSVGLLGQVLAKQAAVEAGVDDAWMVEDGVVTEGSSSTAFIVDAAGTLVTRPNSHAVLPGITRKAILKLADELQMRIEERAFTLGEAKAAAEAFYTSASSFVMPVVEIDGTPIGEGKPGPVASRLREIYFEFARSS